MSVLQTLKGALKDVQQVGSSIAPLKSFKKKRQRPKVYAGVEGVDLDAGADLLNKFHEQWSDMHQQAEHNARAAQKVDSVLRSQYEKCEQQAEAMNRLAALSAGLPHLLTDITKLLDKIGALQEQCQAVEDGLVTLVNVNESVEMQSNKKHHQQRLAIYKQRKALDLEQVKVSMAKDHAKKVEGYEAKLQEHLRVKQEVFEEAFAKEMQNYRDSGSTEMKPTLGTAPQDVELSDISIDQDNSALDAFLDSDEGSSDTSQATVTIEEEDDGDEDSYINIGILVNDISEPELDVLAKTNKDNPDQIIASLTSDYVEPDALGHSAGQEVRDSEEIQAANKQESNASLNDKTDIVQSESQAQEDDFKDCHDGSENTDKDIDKENVKEAPATN